MRFAAASEIKTKFGRTKAGEYFGRYREVPARMTEAERVRKAWKISATQRRLAVTLPSAPFDYEVNS